MKRWEKYFSTPERTALTLCDIENEYQFAIRHGIRNNVEPKDEEGKELSFDEVIHDSIICAIHPLLVLFDWMGTSYFDRDEEKKKEYTLVPTTAHEFLEWLQEECDD